MLQPTFDKLLVFASLLVAVLTSYTALDLARRISTATPRAARWWLAGGAWAMGTGIWSMHFIGMLALRLPIPLGYGLPLTLASLVIAVLASGFALWQASQQELTIRQLGASATVMGVGIAAMHYTGMASMDMSPPLRYDGPLLAASVLIAIMAAGFALKISHALRTPSGHDRRRRALAAVIMGGAIAGMHYTGIAAAGFVPGSVCRAADFGLSPRLVSVQVLVVTLAVLAITFITSLIDARMARQTRRLVSANRDLEQRSLHDSLTGLPNRAMLDNRLNSLLASDKGASFALMFLDLDGFKAINDTFGHHAGDIMLTDVAGRIQHTLRARDMVVRLGGDEFVVLAEVSNAEDAASVARKLNAAISAPFPGVIEHLSISASIGIALYPGDGATQHELMVNADAAMYHAKQTGRNTFSVFQRSMNENAAMKLALMQDLRRALARQEFELHYQPKVDSRSGRLKGFEALLRWRHPVHGMVSPAAFIELAERSGIIVELGAWVLREACRQLRAWHDAGHSGWTVAVNLSAVQFSNEALVEQVQDVLREHGLEPSSLTLEITESIAMRDVSLTRSLLARLVELGVQVSIDDFGTGFSSLMYLQQFPSGELKIDRGFIKDLTTDSKVKSIVAAIVGLGHALDLKIVAEGVENEVQQRLLTELGCDMLQGYYIARPMPPAEVPALARRLDAGAPAAA